MEYYPEEGIVTSENNTVDKCARLTIKNRELGKRCLAVAFVLPVGMYLSEFSVFLEEPLFEKIYYGNLNTMFYHIACAIYIFAFVAFFHRAVKLAAGFTPFEKKPGKLSLKRKAILYAMTLFPVFITSAALDFRFKLVYGLGERVTGMTLLGNGVGYVHAAAKLLCALYFIALVEQAFEAIYHSVRPIPVGGILAAATFGVAEMIFAPSAFSLLHLFLIGYFGVVYLVSEKRFGITYALALIMYIL